MMEWTSEIILDVAQQKGRLGRSQVCAYYAKVMPHVDFVRRIFFVSDLCINWFSNELFKL